MPNTTSQSNNINATDWWLTGYTIKDGKNHNGKGKNITVAIVILIEEYTLL
jgi:hypothetical protein